MKRNVYNITLKFERYVAEPYLPELDDVINIAKKSGMNRVRSEAKRESSLKSYLTREGITEEAYATLVAAASKKWYYNNDGFIIVPRHHIAGCLVQAVKTSTAAIRGKFDSDSFRHHVRIGDFTSDRRDKDTVFDRYVKNDATNQRRRTISEVIENFTAKGVIEVNEIFKLKDFKTLLEYALEETGCGSCRKMGFGRAEVVSIEEVEGKD